MGLCLHRKPGQTLILTDIETGRLVRIECDRPVTVKIEAPEEIRVSRGELSDKYPLATYVRAKHPRGTVPGGREAA